MPKTPVYPAPGTSMVVKVNWAVMSGGVWAWRSKAPRDISNVSANLRRKVITWPPGGPTYRGDKLRLRALCCWLGPPSSCKSLRLCSGLRVYAWLAFRSRHSGKDVVSTHFQKQLPSFERAFVVVN